MNGEGVSTLPGLRTYTPEDAERINNGGPGRWFPEAHAAALVALEELVRLDPHFNVEVEAVLERLDAAKAGGEDA